MDPTPIFSGNEIAQRRRRPDARPAAGREPDAQGDGARLFDEFAAAHCGERFAIVLDGIVMSAPVIKAAASTARPRSAAASRIEEMNNLVTVLKFGSLPLEIKEVGFSA